MKARRLGVVVLHFVDCRASCCARRESWGRMVVGVFGLIGVDGMGWRFWEFEIWRFGDGGTFCR